MTKLTLRLSVLGQSAPDQESLGLQATPLCKATTNQRCGLYFLWESLPFQILSEL